MNKKEIFDRLADHLGKGDLTTFPKTKELFEMFEILFTPEQAEIALQMPVSRMGEITVEDLARKMGKPFEAVLEKVEAMARAGTVQAIRRGEDKKLHCSAFPLVPGILESNFGTEIDTEKVNRLATLWLKYHNDLWEEMSHIKHPVLRIIPINERLDMDSRVLPFEEASNVVKSAKTITVINCHCRSAEKKCNHIMEACVVLNDWAESLIEYRGATRWTVEEVIQRLKECEEDGLVHLTGNMQEGSYNMCNCCPCCCGVLTKHIELQGNPILSRTNFAPVVDQDLCTLCLNCTEVCSATAINEIQSQIVFEDSLCIGCGLCSTHCPEDAIQMKKIRDVLPAKTGKELIEKLLDG